MILNSFEWWGKRAQQVGGEVVVIAEFRNSPFSGAISERMQRLVLFLLITMLSSCCVSSYRRIYVSAIRETRFRMLSNINVAADKVITLEPRTPSNSITTDSNALYSQDSVPLQSLINLASLKNVISQTSFEKASAIQQQSYAPIFAGKDVIVGAETGSGKTLAYFLPLLDRYLSLKVERPIAEEQAADSWVEAAEKLQPYACPQIGVILAPSNPLCDQVMSMVSPVVDMLKEYGESVRLSKFELVCMHR